MYSPPFLHLDANMWNIIRAFKIKTSSINFSNPKEIASFVDKGEISSPYSTK